MKSIIATILLAACAITAQAQEQAERANWLPNTVGAHVHTLHSQPGFNDHTPGLFMRWADASGAGWGAGVYKNSERATSAWAGYTFTTPSITALRLRGELTLGGVTGYQSAELLPLAMPGLSAAIAQQAQGEARVHLGYIPKFEKRGSDALHLMLSYQANLL
jgi:hypothetical protein